jgi:hypothetical protein
VVRQHINDAADTLLPHPDTLSTEGGVPRSMLSAQRGDSDQSD